MTNICWLIWNVIIDRYLYLLVYFKEKLKFITEQRRRKEGTECGSSGHTAPIKIYYELRKSNTFRIQAMHFLGREIKRWIIFDTAGSLISFFAVLVYRFNILRKLNIQRKNCLCNYIIYAFYDSVYNYVYHKYRNFFTSQVKVEKR